jgi:hypothetical protein
VFDWVGKRQTKGHSKQTPTDPDVYLINFRGTNQPQIFFVDFCFSALLAFLGKGSFKNTIKKVHVEIVSRKNRQKIRVSFSSTLIVYRVFGCFSAMGVQTLQKTFYKKMVSKSICKKIDKKLKPIFSRFVYHVLGRFSVRGVQKHDQKNRGKKLASPGTCLAFEEPTNHIGICLYFGVPLEAN